MKINKNMLIVTNNSLYKVIDYFPTSDQFQLINVQTNLYMQAYSPDVRPYFVQPEDKVIMSFLGHNGQKAYREITVVEICMFCGHLSVMYKLWSNNSPTYMKLAEFEKNLVRLKEDHDEP